MNGKLTIALLSIVVLALTLCVALVWVAIKPRPIYYVPGVGQGGVAMEQSKPGSTAAAFASAWALNWSNFTPATIEGVYGRAQQYMSPFMLTRTQTRLGKEIEEVKRNNISCFFSMTGDPEVESDAKGFKVTLRGNKGVYMGKEELKIQRIVFHLRLIRVHPTETNPYGLMIGEIDQEVEGDGLV